MRNGLVHGHVLQVFLLVGHNNVDIARALKAVIGDTQRGYLRLAADSPANIRALVDYQVEKPGSGG
jgi:hypothetical protein